MLYGRRCCLFSLFGRVGGRRNIFGWQGRRRRRRLLLLLLRRRRRLLLLLLLLLIELGHALGNVSARMCGRCNGNQITQMRVKKRLSDVGAAASRAACGDMRGAAMWRCYIAYTLVLESAIVKAARTFVHGSSDAYCLTKALHTSACAHLCLRGVDRARSSMTPASALAGSLRMSRLARSRSSVHAWQCMGAPQHKGGAL
jgi:hypothetical protein